MSEKDNENKKPSPNLGQKVSVKNENFCVQSISV